MILRSHIHHKLCNDTNNINIIFHSVAPPVDYLIIHFILIGRFVSSLRSRACFDQLGDVLRRLSTNQRPAIRVRNVCEIWYRKCITDLAIYFNLCGQHKFISYKYISQQICNNFAIFLPNHKSYVWTCLKLIDLINHHGTYLNYLMKNNH